MKRSDMVNFIYNEMQSFLALENGYVTGKESARILLSKLEYKGMVPPISYEPTTGQATHVIHIDGVPTGAVAVYKWEKE